MLHANNRDGSASRHVRGRGSNQSGHNASPNASSARQLGPRTDPSTGEPLPASIQGWDARTRLAALFQPTEASGLESGFASIQLSGRKSATTASTSDAQVEKRAKPLWRSYAPRLLTSFKCDRIKQDESTFDKSEAEVVAQTANQLQLNVPCAVYQKPCVPLTLETLDRQVVVTKQPLSTVLQAAARIDIDPTKTSEKAMSSVSSSSGSANDDKAKQSGAIAKVESDPPRDITFVGFRNSFRSLLSTENKEWRIDLTRIGKAILMRRYMSYFQESFTDAGHLFEYACTKGNTVGSRVVGRELTQVQDGSAFADYRALVETRVGAYTVLMSTEIDLATRQHPTDCSQFREVKCIIPQTLHNEDHAESIWVLCALAGIETVICGFKGRQHYSQKHIPRIDEIREVSVESLISDGRKEACTQQYHELLAFMHRNVQEGKSYKLVKECVNNCWRIALHEIRRDTKEEEVNEAPAASLESARLKRKMQQVMSPTLIAEIQQWAAEEREKDRIKQQQQRQEAECKKQEEQRLAQQKALELEQKQKQVASAAAAKATASDSASASAATRAAPDERASASSTAAAAASSASSASVDAASAEPVSGQQPTKSIGAKIASKSETRSPVAGDETAAPSAAASASSSRDERDRLLALMERHTAIAEKHTAITTLLMDELRATR